MSDWTTPFNELDAFSIRHDANQHDDISIGTPILLWNNDLVSVYWTGDVLTDYSKAHNEAWLMGSDADGFKRIAEKVARRRHSIIYNGRFDMEVDEPSVRDVIELAQCVAESVAIYQDYLRGGDP